ncbi:DUF6319 family protein [Pseudonocardia alaniniphila]|uniref:DUF6319 family protein n=1 Tax=Pseudonocardia alaniniphila TaxID=75291 RepID=A0ABS9TV81_9PSEU|nr:DUF6319 family protein [Pseudonocardia alaniniphila]MCH6172146.1 DUF6319 family protein [Pseudonocardia alaniniphila]
MVAANPLSEQDLAEARQELAAGRPLTVWFTPAAVGVPANGSAKVISIDEVAEGDFIQVKPAGSRDTMFCSPSELTRTRPARKKVQRPAERAPESIVPSEEAPQASAPEKPRSVPEPEWTPAPPPPAPQKAPPPAPAPVKAPDRPRSTGSRSAGRPAEVTVTLNATAEGEWTVEVMIGKKRTVRPTPVQPGDVAKAARALPSVVAEAIDASLEAARQRQLERVERLSAELEAAQRALHELIS